MSQVIEHNGRKIRTNWPNNAFRTTINVTIANGQPIVNHGIKCAHCENAGIVLVDQTNIGAACPMCSVGRLQNMVWKPTLRYGIDGKPIRQLPEPPELWSWHPTTKIDEYTWNNGCTINDTAICKQCSTYPAPSDSLCRLCNEAGNKYDYHPSN